MITFGSLFAGIGGFDLGFEQAGMRGLWQVEKDVHCRKVLTNHFKETQIYEDIQTINPTELPKTDVICGGFPCQDLSVAGRRAGLAGARSGLWFEFLRIIRESCPRIVVIENVPGLLSSAGGRDFAIILQGLAQLGYCAAWRVLDAQYFGVPQRRRRVFVVASFGDGRCAQILFDPPSLCGNSAPGRPPRKSAAGGGGRSTGSGDWGRVSGTVSCKWAKGTGGPSGDECQNLVVVAASPAHSQQGRTLIFDPSQITRPTHRGSPQPGAPCHCLAAQSKPPVLARGDTAGVRRLTPIECERLQGFPDHWTAGQSDTARYRQLGNAVAVPVARWLGQRIVKFV